MERLKLNVLRGENQIGENLIEITDRETNILLECGIPLIGTEDTKEISEQVIAKVYDAIIISHSHIDHSGLLIKDVSAKKIYMGKDTFSILSLSNMISDNNKEKVITFTPNSPFNVGDIEITPYLCDHSAFDSYMLLISYNNDRILYTGDYRSSGRKNFDALLDKLPKNIDLLITEGTNLKRNDFAMTEERLEKYATDDRFKEYKKVFVLQSVTNVDRAVSFYKASVKNNKPYILNLPMAKHYANFKNIPDTTYKNCFTYLSKGIDDKDEHDKIINLFGKKLLSKKDIAKLGGFTMQIQANMSNYLLKLKEEGFDFNNSVLVYSTWKGYKQTFAKEIIETFNSLGVYIIDLHASGHADKETIDKLISTVSPKQVIYVHKEPNLFAISKIKEELNKGRFKEALEIAIKHGCCGDSLLQRKMAINFYEAHHYIKLMRDFGILGEVNSFETEECLIKSLSEIEN